MDLDTVTIDHSKFRFVFGSNLEGWHGKGVALTAKTYFGARQGVGEGPTGHCYALPTKGINLETLRLNEICAAIATFVDYASDHLETQFMITRVGCGLAGYSDEKILACFLAYSLPNNVHLPGIWLSKIDPDMEMRVIVAGGRKFHDSQMLDSKCNYILSSKTDRNITIVSGAASGADQLGEEYYRKRKLNESDRWKLVRFPAASVCFGKAAVSLRNSAMAWYSTNAILFWDQRSKDTKKMIEIAGRDNLNFRVIRY